MKAPKAKKRPWHSEYKFKQGERKHLNKKFYNSKAWRDTRIAYLYKLEKKIHEEILHGFWTVNDNRMEVEVHKVSYILSVNLPCETCLRHYISDAYNDINEGKELDHIIPLNPENALDTVGYYMEDDRWQAKDYGDPFDFNNLMYLCRRHHAKKSTREKQK